tara:strand:+ start:271 stop:720 length:450 start_codon:yes stop_codon:yes gene_type:complete
VQDPNKFYGRTIFQHPYGTIQISLNKPYYIDGEQVVGQVHLRLHQPLNVNGVILHYFGEEKVRITTETSTANQACNTHHHHGGHAGGSHAIAHAHHHSNARDHVTYHYDTHTKVQNHIYFDDKVSLQVKISLLQWYLSGCWVQVAMLLI